ncbi:MAG: zinc-ribbon domain containing protein [Verrucomicrobiota bacterium]
MPKRSRKLINGEVLPSHMQVGKAPRGAVPADRRQLDHINTYGDLPEYYVDYPFTCVDCGKEEVWKAEQQKWYYEEAKGHIDAFAKRCRPCRKRRKENGSRKASH